MLQQINHSESQSKIVQRLRVHLRLNLHILIFLSALPGLLLAIYFLKLRTHDDLSIFLLIAICVTAVFWFLFEHLIEQRVQDLIDFSKHLSAGDVPARSNPADRRDPLGELTLSLDRVADTLEKQSQQIQSQTKQIIILHELINEIMLEPDFSTFMEFMLEKAMAFLNASSGSLSLYDQATGNLVVITEKGFKVPIGMKIRKGEGSAGRAAQTLELVIIPDAEQMKSNEPDIWECPGSRVIQLPMVYQGELVGVLGVAVSDSTYQFIREELHQLNLYAGQLAYVLKNAHLFDDTHRRLQIMNIINEVSKTLRDAKKIDDLLLVLLEDARSIVNANMGGIWLYDPASNSLHQTVSIEIPKLKKRISPKEGIIGKVFTSGQPYYQPNWSGDNSSNSPDHSHLPPGTSGAFIPIRSTHMVVGVLVLGFRSSSILPEDQKHLLIVIAETAGNIIQHMQLNEKTVSQLNRLKALHRIDLAITGSLDLKHTLQTLLNQIIKQLGVDAACVLTYNPRQQTFEFAASRGFTTNALRNTHLAFGEGYAGLAAKERRTIYIPDLKRRKANILNSASFSAEGFVSYYAVPLVARNQVRGVLEIFHRSRLKKDDEWLDFLRALANQAAIAIENASLYSDLQQSNIELNRAYDLTIEGWSQALDLRDQETEGHSQRVAELTLRLAKAMSIDEKYMVDIRRGALLHDIGKLGIPDHILLKNGPLDDEEKATIKEHPVIAYELLAQVAYLRPALDIPYCHHERWDGSGYPRGLKGEQIPLAARIFTVVDVWDALRSDRPYRKAWSEDQARAFLREQAGKQFDQAVVTRFLDMLEDEK